MKIDGTCYCGAIRFTAEADPACVSVCHCTDCQSLTGTAFRTSILARDGSLRVTAGTPALYVKTADNGRPREQHFCGTCGSPLFTREEGTEGPWHLRWGAVRQREAFAPQRQIWRRSAVPWLDVVAGLPGRDGD